MIKYLFILYVLTCIYYVKHHSIYSLHYLAFASWEFYLFTLFISENLNHNFISAFLFMMFIYFFLISKLSKYVWYIMLFVSLTWILWILNILCRLENISVTKQDILFNIANDYIYFSLCRFIYIIFLTAICKWDEMKIRSNYKWKI